MSASFNAKEEAGMSGVLALTRSVASLGFYGYEDLALSLRNNHI